MRSDDIVPLVLFVIMVLIVIFASSDQISLRSFLSLHGSNAGNSTPVAQ
jgi:hypothetical protein